MNEQEKKSYPFIVWSGILTDGHTGKMNQSIWLFLWCINKITHEKDSKGYVLGGTPIKIQDIADQLHFSYRTIERWLKRLEKHQYITIIREPNGVIIIVNKSKKWTLKKVMRDLTEVSPPDKNVTLNLTDVASLPDRCVKSALTDVSGQNSNLTIQDKDFWGGINQLDKTDTNHKKEERDLELEILREWNSVVIELKLGRVRKGLIPKEKELLRELIRTGITKDNIVKALQKYKEIGKEREGGVIEYKYCPRYLSIQDFIEKQGVLKFTDDKYINGLLNRYDNG